MTALGRLGAALELLAVVARAEWALMRASSVTILFTVVQPAALLVVTVLPHPEPTPAVVTRTAVAVMLTSVWTATVWSAAGVLRRERAWGTLARSLTGRHDARLVVLGRGAASSAATVLLVGVTVAVVLLLMRQPLTVLRPGWFAVGLVVLFGSGSAAGLLVGTIMVVTRYGHQVSAALMYPVFLLGGMLIPTSVLPAPLRLLSAGISLRWLQEFLTAAATGRPAWAALGYAGALTAGYALLGGWIFERMVTRARREASLDLL